MQNLYDNFKDCKSRKISKPCPKCNEKLHRKRLKVDPKKYKGLRKLGIVYKAVDYCIGSECSFLEQGVLYFDGKDVKFLNLDEIEVLMKEKLKKKD